MGSNAKACSGLTMSLHSVDEVLLLCDLLVIQYSTLVVGCCLFFNCTEWLISI